MTLSFRAIDPPDLPGLVDLWIESWSEVHAGIDFEARRGWFLDHVSGWIARGALCRAAFDSDDGRMVGFLLVDAGSGMLDQICVRRDLKGAGTGCLLLAEAKRLCPRAVTLSVNTMNARAIRFYEREGFSRTGEGINPTSGLPIFHYRWQP